MHNSGSWLPSSQAGELEHESLRIRASGWNGPLPGAIACGLLAAYFLVEAFFPFSVFRLILGLATASIAVLLSRRGTLSASRGEIAWHTVLLTRRWPYSAVDHFEVARRSNESTGSVSRVLRMHLADGKAQWLGALHEPASQGSLLPVRWRQEQPDLDEVAEELNRILSKPATDTRHRVAG
ncbi:MAG: hypothetical protein WAM97_04425 [Acidimicrobiales bacterium]